MLGAHSLGKGFHSKHEPGPFRRMIGLKYIEQAGPGWGGVTALSKVTQLKKRPGAVNHRAGEAILSQGLPIFQEFTKI